MPRIILKFQQRQTLSLAALFYIISTCYLLPSGYPQIATLVLPLLLLSILGRPLGRSTLWQKCRDFYQEFPHLCLFVVLTIIINLTHSLINADLGPLVHSCYFLYNLCVFYCFLKVAQNDHHSYFSLLTFVIHLLAICFFFLSFFEKYSSMLLLKLFFNNPNQLGLFCVVSTSIVLLQNKKEGAKIWEGISHALFVYLSVQSGSRAAIASTIFIALVPLSKKVFMGILAGILFLGLLSYLRIFDVLSLVGHSLTPPKSLYYKLSYMHSLADELRIRGYYRMLSHFEYLFWGAGEGLIERFPPLSLPDSSQIVLGELHSSLGTVLFSYGFIGLTLFMLFLLKVFKGANSNVWYGLTAILFISMFQNTLRSPYLWIYFSMVYSMGQLKRDHSHPSP